MSSRVASVICDVDGTLALHHQRDPYRWQHSDTDTPNRAVVAVMRAVYRSGIKVVFVSGRPESARAITEEWIAREVRVPGPLFMRASNDTRKDVDVKREIFFKHIEPVLDVVAVFDDRDQVVRMWREELGLTCFQVADGNF